MKKLNQKGFGLWELLLLLLVILILILLGWWVWKQNNENKPAGDSTPAQSSEEKKAEEKPKETPKKYLEIKELGVKVELDDATSDAYYVMKNGYAYISTASLKAADPECAADKTGVVAMAKVKKTDEGEPSGGGAMPGETYEEAAKKPDSNVVIIGDYAYYISRSQAYCSENVDTKAKQQAAWNAFLAKAKTIQAL